MRRLADFLMDSPGGLVLAYAALWAIPALVAWALWPELIASTAWFVVLFILTLVALGSWLKWQD